ncbi:hypothetical protein ACFZCY_18915 [Streptomyces sp. NPDC007983]|uniref:hypothetical protein n=1 Tax=Streptomyces sp. NPDC007983 TaxID=3364800 RepID=UPI0036E1CAE6
MNRAMYGTCGDWVYVLEDWGMATWATGYRTVESMRPAPGEETAVGNYCGLSIDQEAVQAGDLPAVLIPMV